MFSDITKASSKLIERKQEHSLFSNLYFSLKFSISWFTENGYSWSYFVITKTQSETNFYFAQCLDLFHAQWFDIFLPIKTNDLPVLNLLMITLHWFKKVKIKEKLELLKKDVITALENHKQTNLILLSIWENLLEVYRY